MEGRRWYAVQTEPASERLAADEMREAGFQSFCPMERVDRGRGARRAAVLRPYFPRYLFVTFDISADPWGCLFRTRGVTQLVTSQFGRPMPLPTEDVEGLMRKAAESIFGVVTDNTDAAVAEREAKRLGPQIEGREVKLLTGVFTGFTAQCLAVDTPEQRVRLLLDLFGRKTEIEAGLSEVEIV